MDSLKKEIPFVLNNKRGIVEVCYEVNKSPNRTGFDLFQGLDFDAEICRGYPTMHAYVKHYDGSGDYTLSAWIQIITDKFYSSLSERTPTKVVSEVDLAPNIRNLGVPFLAYGSLSEIYDAPCHNLDSYARLKWIADTFMVTNPCWINDNTITSILGFRWGYEESDIDGKLNVKLLPLEVIDLSIWEKHLPLLKENFPAWKFK